MARKRRRARRAAKLSLAQLQKLVEGREKEIEKLAARRDALQSTLAEVEQALTVAKGSGPTKGSGPSGGRKTVGRKKAGRRKGAKRKKKATRARRPAKVNTRTEEGRAALDAAVGKVLASAKGPSRAESIRAAVGGTAAQVRQSLSRLMAEKKVTKSGQKRGTAYSLRGKAGTPAKTASKPRGRKKKSARKKKAGS